MIKQNFFPSKHLQNALNQQINTLFTLQAEFFIGVEYVSLNVTLDFCEIGNNVNIFYPLDETWECVEILGIYLG